MLIEHDGHRPRVHPTAWVAPNAVLSGDVRVGPDSRVLFGAVLTAEGAPITVGSACIVMENAVLRGAGRHPLTLGDHVLVGPRAYLSGCTIKDHVFLATGATVFNGATLGERAEVRINGVVHLRTPIPPGTTVPIGWIAVGDPAELHPPADDVAIRAVQEPLDFPGTIFGVPRARSGETNMRTITRRYARALDRHRGDKIIDE
jgi:carbonic anhydrase/acetyltransferase-like protein (isoleucine patch superfamily)